MKHALARLTGLLIVLTLMLSGCNLIAVDPVMQLDEDLAALKKDYSTVVATYDGGEITKEDVMANFLYQYSYYGYMYSMYGGTMDEEMVDSLKQNTLEYAVQNIAIEKQFDERGLTLTEDQLAEIGTSTDDTYKQAYDSYYANAEGETDEVKAKQTEYNMYADGYTRDIIYNGQVSQAKYEAVLESVNGEIAEVSDEELAAAYEEKVAEDEEQYADAHSSFETAMSSTTTDVYWMPEGYRTVKHILVIPEESVLNAFKEARTNYSDAEDALADLETELSDLNDDDAEDVSEDEEAEQPRSAEEIQADIDVARQNLATMKTALDAAEAACLAAVQDKTDEIYARIESGENFDQLIETYGEDPGMQNEPTNTRGYYVCADSTKWDESFTRGAMLLENPGDVSETPVVSASGVHIIRYETDVTPGAVPMETVRDQLYEDTLENLRAEHFDNELTAWVEALNPQYDTAALKIE